MIGALVYLWFAPMDNSKAMRLATIVIAAVTTLYAFFTYAIMRQNKTLAEAAMQSARTMEQSLRFSHAANLLFFTRNTKDPTFQGETSLTPIGTEEYRHVLREHQKGAGQKE